MKLLAIISSHRRNGNTLKVVSMINEEVRKIAIRREDFIEIETLFLADYTIHNWVPCMLK